MSFANAARRSLAWLFLLGAAFGAHAEEAWIADQNGCKLANFVPKPGESVTWTGGCVDGFADGEGIENWYVNGERSWTFTGTMKAGKAAGPGLQEWSSGNRFQGDYVEGHRTGHGVLDMPKSGYRYEGEFLNSARSGHGVAQWATGERYEGNFDSGRASGQGVFEGRGGYRYEGSFAAGWPQGKGRAISVKGNRYDGEFARGMPSPNGQVTTVAGEVVTGLRAIDFLAEFMFPAPGTPFASMQIPPITTRITIGANLVCTKKGSPEIPPIHWVGQALFNATATVHDGRVVSVKVEPLHAILDPSVANAFIASIERAMRDTYVCPGDHVIVQEFMFNMAP